MVRTIWSVGLIAVVPLCVMAVMLSSCATPKLPLPALVAGDASDALPPEALSEALQGSWARQTRVSGLAYPLRLLNAKLCGADTAKDLGIEWITLADLPKTNPRVAGTILGVERLPFVAVVTPGSPADQGGIRQGDSLLSVNGRPFPAAAEEYNAYVTINTVTVPWYRRRVDGMLAEAVGSGSPAEVAIRREGEELNLFVRTVDACDYNVLAVEDSDLGIAGHGKSVLVSTATPGFRTVRCGNPGGDRAPVRARHGKARHPGSAKFGDWRDPRRRGRTRRGGATPACSGRAFRGLGCP